MFHFIAAHIQSFNGTGFLSLVQLFKGFYNSFKKLRGQCDCNVKKMDWEKKDKKKGQGLKGWGNK